MDKIRHPTVDFEDTEAKIEYKYHPSLNVLKRYLLKQLPYTLPSPEEILPRLVTGELAEEEWTSLLVGAHVRTCDVCASKIEELKSEPA